MIKKLAAMLLSAAMCLCFAACGNENGNGSSIVSATDSSSAPTESDTQKDNSEVNASKSETDGEEQESSAHGSEKTDDTEQSSSPSDTIGEDDSSEETTVPDDEDEWVEGTGYKLCIGTGWVNADAYKSMVEELIKENGKEQFNLDNALDLDICLYYVDGDITDGAPCLTVEKPAQNPLFKDYDIKNLESTLTAKFQAEFGNMDGASIEPGGITQIGGVDALEYLFTAEIEGVRKRSRQFVVINGEYMYNINFSIPADRYDSLKDEMDKILGSIIFTEA